MALPTQCQDEFLIVGVRLGFLRRFVMRFKSASTLATVPAFIPVTLEYPPPYHAPAPLIVPMMFNAHICCPWQRHVTPSKRIVKNHSYIPVQPFKRPCVKSCPGKRPWPDARGSVQRLLQQVSAPPQHHRGPCYSFRALPCGRCRLYRSVPSQRIKTLPAAPAIRDRMTADRQPPLYQRPDILCTVTPAPYPRGYRCSVDTIL